MTIKPTQLALASLLLTSLSLICSWVLADEQALSTVIQAKDSSFTMDDGACYRIPGLVLEMGSDQPLDNFDVCFETLTSAPYLRRTMLPLAHHYLNVNHWLVQGELVCRAGGVSTQMTVFNLNQLLHPEAFFVQVFSQCGAQGCEYELNYLTQASSPWCQQALAERTRQ